MYQRLSVSSAEVDISVLEGRLYIRLKSLLPGYITARIHQESVIMNNSVRKRGKLVAESRRFAYPT